MQQSGEHKIRSFRNTAAATLIVVFMLILIGSTVRSTGAGMGCPDWPKCFGQWVPPTNEAQLPANYREIYKNRGYADTEFNAVKTWTEYFNRLFGVFTGFFIIGTFIASVRIQKFDPVIFWVSLSALILVIFQGWLGGMVVSSNLAAYMISLHLFIAMIIVAVLVYVFARAMFYKNPVSKSDFSNFKILRTWIYIIFSLTIIQFVLGSNVRGIIESYAHQIPRLEWLSGAGLVFDFHRHISIFVLIVNVWFFYKVFKSLRENKTIISVTTFMMIVLILQIMTGLILYYFSLPAFAQSLHVLFASLLFASQFYLISMFHIYHSLSESKKSPVSGFNIQMDTKLC